MIGKWEETYLTGPPTPPTPPMMTLPPLPHHTLRIRALTTPKAHRRPEIQTRVYQPQNQQETAYAAKDYADDCARRGTAVDGAVAGGDYGCCGAFCG